MYRAEGPGRPGLVPEREESRGLAPLGRERHLAETGSASDDLAVLAPGTLRRGHWLYGDRMDPRAVLLLAGAGRKGKKISLGLLCSGRAPLAAAADRHDDADAHTHGRP